MDMSNAKKEIIDIKVEDANNTIANKNKKKKKTSIFKIILGCLLIIVVLFSVCSAVYNHKRKNSFYIKTDFYETKNKSNDTFKLPEEKIIFVSHHVNYAWGYDNAGYFIDSKAQLYFFDINDYLTTNAQEDINELMPYLELVKKNTKPSAKINMKYVKQIYELTSKINTKAQYSSIHTACDAGATDIFCYNPTTEEYIMCFSTGDKTKILEDKYAKKIKDIYDDVITNAINSTSKSFTRTSMYPLSGIYFKNITCKNANLKGNYIAFTEKELLKFGDQYDCDVASIILECKKREYDEYMYFIKFYNSKDAENIDDSSILLWNNKRIDFILNNIESNQNDDESDVTQCFIAAVPAVYNVDILSDIKDANNKSWQRINSLDINNSSEVYRDTTIITNSKEYEKFRDNEFPKGYVIIKSEGMYHTFLSRLGIHNLKTKEYEILNDFFEKKTKPNFDEGVLFVKFNWLSNTEKITENDMLLLDKSLYTGVEIEETNSFSLFTKYKGVITYVYIPNKYLDKEVEYVVR